MKRTACLIISLLISFCFLCTPAKADWINLSGAESAPNTAHALQENRGAATVLITSQDRKVSVGHARPNGVNPLPRDEAAALFSEHTGDDHDPNQLDQLCDLLGDLPRPSF